MKKQTKPNIKAHLLRGAFYLLLLLAVCAIPIALAQRRSVSRTQQLPGAHADAVSKHFTGGKQLHQPAPVYRNQPVGFDCDDPSITKHDDGTIEDGYSGNAAVVQEVRFCDKFTPTSYPNSYSQVCLDFVTLAGGPPTYSIDVVVFDDDGPGGQPGTLLGSLNGQTATTHVFSPGQTPIWNSYDISSLGINITEGSVYIGTRFVPAANNVFISADESTGHPVGFAGGFWWNNADNAWATIQSAFPAYRSCMIRALPAVAGPSPTPTPTPTPTCQPSYFENFDGVTPPALPADWTATQGVNNGGFPFWVTSNSGVPTPVADSPPNALFTLDPANLLDNRCDSSTFTYIADAQLSFRQNYDLEQSDATTAFDCGVLEISVNGGAFQDIVTAGGSFVTGGYNHTDLSTGFSNPCLPPRPNWSGISNGGSGGFETVTVNLPASGAGQPVKLRWRMCSDDSVSHTGWRIDNVAISGECGTPSPTPTATATATATASVAPRETPTPRPRPTPVAR